MASTIIKETPVNLFIKQTDIDNNVLIKMIVQLLL